MTKKSPQSAALCPERDGRGPHVYTVDLEYDSTGKTRNCEFCGEAPPPSPKPEKVGSIVLRRQLIGRQIINIRMNPFDDGRGGQAMNFEIVLDSGKSVFFFAEETESDYGIRPHIVDTEYTKGSKR